MTYTSSATLAYDSTAARWIVTGRQASRRWFECEICEEWFDVPRWRTHGRRKARFCSQTCRLEAFAEARGPRGVRRSGYRGANWLEQRQKALERDNWTCQRCGTKPKRLDVHHRVRWAVSKAWGHIRANDLSNLTSVCQNCHPAAEAEDRLLYTRHEA